MNSNGFRIVRLQTNNILFFADKTFVEAKEVKFQETKFLIKEKEKLILNTPIKFNRGYIKQEKDSIALT